jgi:hypothetical protein
MTLIFIQKRVSGLRCSCQLLELFDFAIVPVKKVHYISFVVSLETDPNKFAASPETGISEDAMDRRASNLLEDSVCRRGSLCLGQFHAFSCPRQGLLIPTSAAPNRIIRNCRPPSATP